MKCPYCQKEHADEAKFCPVSGKPLIQPPPQPVTDPDYQPVTQPLTQPLPEVSPPLKNTQVCPSCGSPVQEHWSHCVYCSAPLKITDEPPVQPRKINAKWVIGLAALVLLVYVAVGAGLAFYLSAGGGFPWVIGDPLSAVEAESATNDPTSTEAAGETAVVDTPSPAVVAAGEQNTPTSEFNSTPWPEPSMTPTLRPTSTTVPHTPTASAAGPWRACQGTYLSRLHVNDRAVVSSNPNLPNRVRSVPGTSSEIIGYIKPGEKVKILDGPECEGGWTWWQIQSEKTGLTGWTAEGDEEHYWLNPISETSSPSSSPSSWNQGKLAFLVRSGSQNGLYIMDLRTNRPMEMLFDGSGSGLLSALAWSPVGDHVAFNRFPGNLFVMEARPGAAPKRLPACDAASWSPDGDQFICGDNDSGRLEIIDSKTGAVLKTIGDASSLYFPTWSPAGDEYLFVRRDGQNRTSIWLASLTGSGQPRLIAGESSENYAPAWSPDGQWIAFQSNQDRDLSDLWIVDRTGNHLLRLTYSPDGTWSRAPSWSPDGKWLAFVSNQAGGVSQDYGEVFAVSSDGGEVIQITQTGGTVYDWRVSWGK